MPHESTPKKKKRRKKKKKIRAKEDSESAPEASIPLDVDRVKTKLQSEAEKRAQQRVDTLSQWHRAEPASESDDATISPLSKASSDKSTPSRKRKRSSQSSVIIEKQDLEKDEEEEDDFGLYQVSYEDVMSPSPAPHTRGNKLSDDESSVDDDSSSSSIELLCSPDRDDMPKRRRKRKRKHMSRDDDDDDESLGSQQQSPSRKRQRKQQKGTEFNILDEIPELTGEVACNEATEFEQQFDFSFNIESKFASVLQALRAPVQSDHEATPPSVQTMNNKESDPVNDVEAKEEEDEEGDDDNEEEVDEFIVFSVNHPPPKEEKKLKIKMRMTQDFGTIIEPLQNKFGKTVTLSFDGETISHTCTPLMLIQEFDAEDGDLIDANYK